MQLKDYQTGTLGILRRFLEEARVHGPNTAYAAIAGEPEQQARLRGYAGAYKPLEALPDTPYVCLRLPTGGGKTILAAHAVAVARDAWVERDWPLVLWLTPTNTIRRQTVEALKNTRHAYRRVLDGAFSGKVRVFDIADFTHMRPQDIRGNCCIVVGTIQTLRVTSTDGRKVYADNEEMEAHFSAAQQFNAPGLERKEEGGRPKFSFANLLRLHRPLMIVDEAQNAVTGLTREMQARVNPCAIIEFTATPRRNSNILHSVRAQELKRAQMIKLPIRLFEHTAWENAVNAAVAKRAKLAEKAQGELDYIRPVTLFQAQPKGREVTVATLKRHLIETEHVPEDRIAIATGAQRQLDGVNLFDRDCPIEHVITVEALKEGWDCSFAYVFCTVSRVRDATNVEQLLGRVMRMPYARRRRAPDLNRAWAFVSEPTFGEAARALTDKLVGMGFDEDEARENVEVDSLPVDDDGPFGARKRDFAYRAPLAPEVAEKLQRLEGVSVREAEDGTVEIAVAGAFDEAMQQAIAAALPEAARGGFGEAAARYRVVREAERSPAERGETFRVPGLAAEVQGELVFADTDILIEDHDWALGDHPARLDGFSIHETANGFEIDLDGNRLTRGFVSEQEELALDIPVEGWTQEALALWLDRKARSDDIDQADLLRWLSRLVDDLVSRQGIAVSALMRCKFILISAIKDRIAAIRQKERETVYRQFLLSRSARVEVSFDCAFEFHAGMYANQRYYRGGWQFRKHFLGPDRVPAFGGAPDGEETQCARILDSLPQVRFWLRNVPRDPASFRLPLAGGNFYPDFVAKLEDDRLLVVEYKGNLTAKADDTPEKRTTGELWERKSAGRCLFVMVEKTVNGKDMREQLLEKIGA